ncbi:MAG: FKBP-type peptidyl-prolyl cis-trans isomerase [Myxococcota bacterium]|nr:FKBP-type peptidyl-prolyl cis-trans isomerase [Myxococcota bacterium]
MKNRNGATVYPLFLGLLLLSLALGCSEGSDPDPAPPGPGAAEAPVPGNAETLPSGLIISEIVAGDGASPSATDVVEVHYHGTFPDGRVFDSSVQRGQPARFRLDQVIPCWTEGLQLMKVGGKALLICPPEIAYGKRGRPPKIPGNSTLHFEVELLAIP